MPPQREWFEKDYYKVLGVSENASQKDISKAYRALAREHHPDANPGDAEAEERFKEISAAYDVLGDAGKRKEYDEVRRMAASGFGGVGGGFGGGFGGAPGGARVHFGDVGGAGGIDDILGAFFGGERRQGGFGTGARRGADLETHVDLSFDEAVKGTTTAVTVDADRACSACHGSGAEPGTSPTTCPRCAGSGTVAIDQGPFSFSQPCPNCGGAGRIVETPCKRCGGRGVERGHREVQVRIPPGVRDGERIRVKGRGARGAGGGPVGDLYVRVHVPEHPLFERRGRYDLGLTVPVTFTEAALGAEVKVPTLDGRVTVRIPPGTPSGRTLRVRDKGVHKPGGGHGDLLATVEVAVPKKVSKEERDLLEQLAELNGESPRRHLEET